MIVAAPEQADHRTDETADDAVRSVWLHHPFYVGERLKLAARFRAKHLDFSDAERVVGSNSYLMLRTFVRDCAEATLRRVFLQPFALEGLCMVLLDDLRADVLQASPIPSAAAKFSWCGEETDRLSEMEHKIAHDIWEGIPEVNRTVIGPHGTTYHVVLTAHLTLASD